LGCIRLVALNKRELIKTKSTKVSKQPEIKPINLLHVHEFILLNRIFFESIEEREELRQRMLGFNLTIQLPLQLTCIKALP
jgi:hypothetical protein